MVLNNRMQMPCAQHEFIFFCVLVEITPPKPARFHSTDSPSKAICIDSSLRSRFEYKLHKGEDQEASFREVWVILVQRFNVDLLLVSR